jgi:hypothetical protein
MCKKYNVLSKKKYNSLYKLVHKNAFEKLANMFYFIFLISHLNYLKYLVLKNIYRSKNVIILTNYNYTIYF